MFGSLPRLHPARGSGIPARVICLILAIPPWVSVSCDSHNTPRGIRVKCRSAARTKRGRHDHIYPSTVMIALTVALAVVVGVSLGLLGGGGSILTVPLLTYVGGVDAKHAIAMSLLVVGVTS